MLMANNEFSLLPNDAISELTKGIYDDVGHPILKEVGAIGESVMKFVALPFKFLGLTASQLEERYAQFIKKSIEKVPEENRLTPRAVITAPLLDHVKFVFAENDGNLYDMFSNLLANSMHNNIEHLVHPAFVDMLRQMSPLDAEFLHLFFKEDEVVVSEELNWSRSDFQKTLSLESLYRLGILRSISYDDRNDVAVALTSFGKMFRDLCMAAPSNAEKINYVYGSEDIDFEEEENFSYSDSFTTLLKDEKGWHISQNFEYSDVLKGYKEIVLLNIINFGDNDMRIYDLYIDDGNGNRYYPHSQFPHIIPGGKSVDYIFREDAVKQFLSSIMNDRAKYYMRTAAATFDFPVYSTTKRVISLYLKNCCSD